MRGELSKLTTMDSDGDLVLENGLQALEGAAGLRVRRTALPAGNVESLRRHTAQHVLMDAEDTEGVQPSRAPN